MAISLEAELNSFKADFVNRNIGKSPNTPYLYAGDIKTLSTKQTYESPEELANDLIKSINRIKQDADYKPRTRNRFVSSTRSFLEFLERKRKIDKSKLSSLLPTLVLEKTEETRLTLTYSEFEKIMSIVPSNDYIGARDRAIFSLMYYAGITESEAVNLTHRCLKEHRGNLAVKVQGKYKIRALALETETTKEMRNYLQQKKQKYAELNLSALSLEPLFSNKKGNEPICTRQPSRRFQEHAKKAGVKADLHYLRNSYIKSLIDNGKSAKEIVELTGIVNIAHAKNLIKLFPKN